MNSSTLILNKICVARIGKFCKYIDKICFTICIQFNTTTHHLGVGNCSEEK